MKLAYQSRWLRLLIEFFPELPEIRRYRIAHGSLDAQTARRLRREIATQMQRKTPEDRP